MQYITQCMFKECGTEHSAGKCIDTKRQNSIERFVATMAPNSSTALPSFGGESVSAVQLVFAVVMATSIFKTKLTLKLKPNLKKEDTYYRLCVLVSFG